MAKKPKDSLEQVVETTAKAQERIESKRGETITTLKIPPCGIAFMADSIRHNSRIVQSTKERAGLRESMAKLGILQDAKGTLTAGVDTDLPDGVYITDAERASEMSKRQAFYEGLDAERGARFKNAGYLDPENVKVVPVNGLQRSQTALDMVLDGKPPVGDFMVEIQRFADEKSMKVYSSMLNELDGKTAIRVRLEDRIPLAESLYRMGAARADFANAFPPGTYSKLWGALEYDSNFPDEKFWERIKNGIGMTFERGKIPPKNVIPFSSLSQSIGTKEVYTSRAAGRELVKKARQPRGKATQSTAMSVEDWQGLGKQSGDPAIQFVAWCALESKKDALVKALLGLSLSATCPGGYFAFVEETDETAKPETAKPETASV